MIRLSYVEGTKTHEELAEEAKAMDSNARFWYGFKDYQTGLMVAVFTTTPSIDHSTHPDAAPY